jgi:heme-degrading monooxygenase HmoA
MPLISVTRLRVRSFIYLPQFFWDTFKSTRQAEHSVGFLGGRLLVNRKNVFWTMTAWKDEAAMNAFRIGGAHRKAMPKLLNGATRPLSSTGHRNPQKFPHGKRLITA